MSTILVPRRAFLIALGLGTSALALGVMIFPDNIFKYTSNMIKHIPELQP